jgi:hypothetical protein
MTPTLIYVGILCGLTAWIKVSRGVFAARLAVIVRD